jgi:hypothetical protein
MCVRVHICDCVCASNMKAHVWSLLSKGHVAARLLSARLQSYRGNKCKILVQPLVRMGHVAIMESNTYAEKLFIPKECAMCNMQYAMPLSSHPSHFFSYVRKET